MIPRAAHAVRLRVRALRKPVERAVATEGERGWALLGLLLALGVMSIVMASAIVPNVKVQVQRDKEEELLYRGDQMARGIARYYNAGTLAGIQLVVPPPYGYLTELKKLRDGVRLNVRELKFVRPSAMVDPMSSREWEPVRARDPRIMKVLQAFAAETQIPIPLQYLLIAGPPQRLEKAKPSETAEEVTQPPGVVPPRTNPRQPAQDPDDDDDDDFDDDDDDDDDGLTPNDPLKHLFEAASPGSNTIPIVGVAPRVKGKAIRGLYGLDRYEDWVFIFVPDTTQ
ncbi:MAG: hypothetical protein WAU45_14095, partial [Blastocatellia bacterium]